MPQAEWQARWNKKNIERRRKWNREWIANNRAKYNASKARYRFKLKIEVMSLYVSPPRCMQCGYSQIDALVFDHINDDGAVHRKENKISHRGNGGGGRIYEWIRKNGKMEGLQVLCANCNLIKEVRRKRRLSIKDEALLQEIEALRGHN